jgi:tRNA uridine 5-carbamoylmethylation protein Kti12
MTIIVNFLAGPCAGKSTAAGGLFNKLKVAGVQTEYVQEFAKTITWERNYEALKHQPYITGVQMYKQNMLLNLVDVIVTDAPVLLGLMYFANLIKKLVTHSKLSL